MADDQQHQREDEHEEGPVVGSPDAVVEPLAVVVEVAHALVARPAVLAELADGFLAVHAVHEAVPVYISVGGLRRNRQTGASAHERLSFLLWGERRFLK